RLARKGRTVSAGTLTTPLTRSRRSASASSIPAAIAAPALPPPTTRMRPASSSACLNKGQSVRAARTKRKGSTEATAACQMERAWSRNGQGGEDTAGTPEGQTERPDCYSPLPAVGPYLLPLLRRVQHLAGVAAVVSAHDAILGHEVDQPRRPAVTDAQRPLQQR